MAKGKKLNSLSDLGGLVYSTNSDYDNAPADDSADNESIIQHLEAHYVKKGRGGKAVVIVSGFEGTDSALNDMAKRLKQHCATGGSVKDGEIIIQGNQRDKIMAFLVAEGHKVKRVGG